MLAVDIGGTFTDLVAVVDGELRWHKLPSSPPDYHRALLDGLAALGVEPAVVSHGTTVATNALLERRGARCGLITTAGFGDLLAIGRQDRPLLYALEQSRPEPLVPRELRLEVAERVGPDGAVITPLDLPGAEQAVEALVTAGVESVAVCLLFSFARPEHEEAIGELAAARGLQVSLSCRVLPEFREYERTATTVVNAYVAPQMGRYLRALDTALGAAELRVMQSNGGCIDAVTAADEAVRTILSGPAAGVVGALRVGQSAGFERLISFDMGGTSTDVAVLDGGLPLSHASRIAGLPVGVPMLDIQTVGAGGGSIAYRDEGGALAVGPRSAGADPGPACYGRGGSEPTVTDAHLVLGRLPAERFLGGRMRLDRQAAEAAVDRLAGELGLSRPACAEGIVSVANAAMERAIRVITVERGIDPSEFCLVSFGGAGGLHAVDLARALGIRQVLVPPHAGSLSALGLLLSDVVRDGARTVMRSWAEVTETELTGWLDELAAAQRGYLAAPGIDQVTVLPSLDLRYRGQSFELSRPYTRFAVVTDDFHAAHAAQYGYRRDEAPIELVTVRVRLVGRVPAPELPRRAGGVAPVTGGVRRLESLAAGAEVRGPVILTGDDTTVRLPEGVSGRVDSFGNLLLDLGGPAADPAKQEGEQAQAQ